MYDVSTNFQNAIKQLSRTLSSRVVIGSSEYSEYTDTEIVSMKLESNLVPGEEFALGTTVCSKLELTLLTDNLIQALNVVKPYIGLDIGGIVEEVPLGVFIVDEVKTVKGTKQITAYDNMLKFEKAYFSDLTYPATIQAVATEICQKAGVSFSSTLPNYTIDNRIEGKTLREAIGIIAGICGGFARINRAGGLEIVGLTSTDINIGPENFFGSIEKADKDFTIKKITAIKEDNSTISSGSGSASEEVTFSNNYITQAQLDSILAIYNNYSYRPLKMTWQGNPAIDVGDKITVTDIDGTVYAIPVMRLTLTYSGGLKSEISSIARTDSKSEYDYKGPISKKIERIVTEQANINEALINKANIEDLNAVNARIDSLEVNKANVSDLNATNARVTNLEVNKADISDLTAINARIDNLDVEKASVDDLEAVNARIDNLKVNTAMIDDLAVITAKIADAAVTTAKIANLAVDSAKIKDAAITTAKIATGAITTALIAQGAIGTAQIADGSITDAKIVSLTANKITAGTIDANNVNIINLKADNIVAGALTIDGDNLIHNTAWLNDTSYWTVTTGKWTRDTSVKYDTSNTMKADITGETADKWYAIYSEFIPATAGQKFVASVYSYTDDKTTLDRGAGLEFEWYNDTSRISTTSTSILPTNNNTWQRFIVSGTAPTGTTRVRIRCHPIRNGRIWVARPMLQRGSIASEWKLHTDEQISDGAITNSKIANDAINGNKIADNSITNSHISANTITGDKLVADTITAREIASRTITANEIAVNAITAASGVIADAAITTAKIADGSITTAKIADASITNAKIVNLDAGKITTGTLDASKVNVINLNASNITTGSISANRISGGMHKVGGKDNGYGEIAIYDSSNNVQIRLDSWGIYSDYWDLTSDGLEINSVVADVVNVDDILINNNIRILGLTANVSPYYENYYYEIDGSGIHIRDLYISPTGTITGASDDFTIRNLSGDLIVEQGYTSSNGTYTSNGYILTLTSGGDLEISGDLYIGTNSKIRDNDLDALILSVNNVSNGCIYLRPKGDTNTGNEFVVGYNRLTYAGYTVWHAGNDGSGSGLDADLLDGNHASAFLKTSGGTISGSLSATGDISSDRFQGRADSNNFYLGPGNCRVDTAGGNLRLFTSAIGSSDNGIRINSNGQVDIIAGGTTRHSFYTNGTKSGGSIEVDGVNYGMSPIDSPRVLISDILYDVEVEAEGTVIYINSILAKTLTGYAVFPNNSQVRITEKGDNYFKVEGYTGKVDFLIIGNRKDSVDRYFTIMQ